ncbi:probable fatty acyl-CoA reductase 4 [Gastrolobium bilobum]|uniref:probable fatty acyl-CoA reductase 4 n=1 Tax=Gastrolobium bilobum TaxID=150636 RepID=UPI002AB0153D|nr:probable fatty acyl-CoA reductase 4 [Gastrolobium bilobum]
MDSGRVQYFLKGKTILVTGATGFLAKVFVEKILRIQPQTQKLYLLIRAINTELAAQRLQNEVIRTDLFRVLRDECGEDFESFISEKVVVIAGDVALENLGLKDENLKNEMFQEIDVVVNFAASTKFDERFDFSMGVNTMGALHVLNFAKNCHRLEAFVHTSTGKVSIPQSIKPKDGEAIFREKPFEMGQTLKGTSKLDIHTEMNLLEKKKDELRAKNAEENRIKYEMKDYGIERANLYGWPNTYVFTKAMGEMLVVHHKDNVPLIIIRPTMVTSTYEDPFPGWIEGSRTLDSIICGVGQGKITHFLGHPNTILDTIPADLVINCVITAIVARSNQAPKNFIFHVSSSLRNPFKISDVHNISYNYFIKTPYQKNGKPINISKPSLLTSVAAFNISMTIRYVLPLKVLNLVNKVFCQCSQDFYDTNCRKIRMVKRLVELYKPYLFFRAVFDDTNTENLRRETKGNLNLEVVGLNFDPSSIDWKDYMMNSHIPGLVKYAMK